MTPLIQHQRAISESSESSTSKDNESSSLIQHPSLSSCHDDINHPSISASSLPNRQESKFINNNPPVQIEESSKNINSIIYTRRLIPMKYIPAEEIDENFDEQIWFKKLYGPDIIVVSTFGIPEGWILVDGD